MTKRMIALFLGLIIHVTPDYPALKRTPSSIICLCGIFGFKATKNQKAMVYLANPVIFYDNVCFTHSLDDRQHASRSSFNTSMLA